MGSILNISVSGMNAAQTGLQTVQHNVANASTPGYSRQRVAQTATLPNVTGGGYVGTGAQVSSVSRIYDSFLTGQVNKAQTTLSALETKNNLMQSIDQLLADPTAGVAPAIGDFFKAAQQVGAYPSSMAARQTMVSSAQVLVNRMSVMGETINSLNDQINTQIQTDVDALNGYAEQLAEVNAKISNAAVTGYQPNDLLDKRDQLINEIGKLADISTTVVVSPGGPGGEFSPLQVYLGSGHALVSESGAHKATVVRSSEDPTQLTFSIDNKEVKSGDVTGGSLGGLLDFRNGTLTAAQNTLGQVAFALASTFNEQHKTGMDLAGGQGQNFFNILSQVDAVGSPGSAPALSVTLETPQLTGDTITDFYQTSATNSDYTLSMSGGVLTLTRETDGKTWMGADETAINNLLVTDPQGFTLNAPAAAFSDGDSYKIRPMALMATNISVNSAITSDVRLVAAGLAVKASTTAANNVNTGNANTGSMDATVVRMTTNTPPAAPYSLTLSYNAGSNELMGFGGAGVDVTGVNGQPIAGSPFAGNTATYVPGASYKVNGIVFTVSGAPADGDTLTLVLNNQSPVGVSDSSNLLLMAKLETSKTINGTATYGGSYAQMVSNVGNDAASAKATQASQQSLYDLALARRESHSGVNLDEEAADLVRYQQIYQANAKSMQVAQKLFDTLMSIMS